MSRVLTCFLAAFFCRLSFLPAPAYTPGESIFFFDDFDTPAVRIGSPVLTQGIVSPGLLTMTGMGLYRGEKVTVFDRDDGWQVPDRGQVRFSYGFRLYSFGDAKRTSSRLVTRFAEKNEAVSFEIRHDSSAEDLIARLNTRELRIPYEALPADFSYVFNAGGEVELKVTSLSDSQVRTLSEKVDFFTKGKRRFSVRTVLESAVAGDPAELKLDNLTARLAFPERKLGDVPAKIEPLTHFDPEKAGWKKTFEDDFNTTSIDTNKWILQRGNDCVSLREGHLVIDCRLNEDGKTLRTGSIRTRHAQTYGYFEARLKFTTENGWWAAFWLYSRSCVNPFVDGFEIDIFEDYYTRRRDELGRPKNIIDHNLHLYLNSTIKSWNYMEKLDGSIDDYHVIGCKWTPFEISYYLDGKLIRSSAWHSPWNSVTFDAFNHAMGVAPLQMVVSGQIMDPNASWLKGSTEFKSEDLPYHYYVDWVRSYEYPDPPDDKPQVAWKEKYPSGEFNLAKGGAKLVYGVDAKPALRTRSPIRAVYLFDNGYLLEVRKSAPYDFHIECTREYFAGTAYLKPGRQKQIPSHAGTHVLIAFAEDENGRIARSEPIRFMLVENEAKSKPFRGKAAKIPGVVRPCWFDEGGHGVGYLDNTRGNKYGARDNWRMNEDVDCSSDSIGDVSHGEWLNFTVDIDESGEYELSFKYGTPVPGPHRMTVLCDLKPVAEIQLHEQDCKYGWGTRSLARTILNLPSGCHVLRLVLDGNFNFHNLHFRKNAHGRANAPQ